MLFTPAQIEQAFAIDDPELHRLVYAGTTHPYYTFEPRPDQPSKRDQQASFVDCNYDFDPDKGEYVYDDNIKFKIQLGGNGSGKTYAAAQKTARHVLEILPPREACPFWIVGEYMDQICNVAWIEKLREIIPDSEILKIVWHRASRGWPRAVVIRHPEDRQRPGWVLEFKSYEQGIGSMKGASIGAYWFNEEVPYSIVLEVQARCREYASPGWADFTPVESKPAWKEAYKKPPKGWKFYHLNSLLNDTLPEGWMEDYLSTVPEDMQDTRKYGSFTSFYGQIFKEYDPDIHFVDPTDPKVQRELGLRSKPPYVPHDWKKVQGVDFGFNNPTCFLWCARDHDQRWYVYDEHYRSGWLVHQHAAEVNKRVWDETDPHYGRRYSEHENTSGVKKEYARHGINLINAIKDPNRAIELLRTLMICKADRRPRFYIFKNCENLNDELQNMRWQTATENRNARDEEVDKANHAVDALRYAIFSEHREGSVESGIKLGRADDQGKRFGVHVSRWR